MDISEIFNTYPAMYITQSICHSIVASFVVERTIRAGKIGNPLVRQRFRIIIILSAVFSMPLYQILNPERGSIIFRQNSLFDSSRWLTLELPGHIPIGLFFIILILLTSLIFILQELIPILKHIAESKKPVEVEESFNTPVLRDMAEKLEGLLPKIHIIGGEDYILFSTTGQNPAIYISRSIINTLTARQLKSVIAHEIAHIKRNKSPLLTIVYFLRMMMFFNPLILIEFRRITQEEEKICDDMAILLTEDPKALSEALRKLYKYDDDTIAQNIKKIRNLKETLEEYSHSIHIESRIRRIERGISKDTEGQWGITFFISLIIMVINYFVV